MNQPPLKMLHSDDHLIPLKIDQYRKLSNQVLLDSLKPGKEGALKARPDGTVIDGHHRLIILRERGIDVDTLPRETIEKDSPVT
jgi:hypothetical protein